MQRNMAQSLIQHGAVSTTLAKARDIRPFVERLVTLAVQVRHRADAGDSAGSLRARRRIHRLLGDRSFIGPAQQADYNAMSDAARAKTMRMPSGRRRRTGEPQGRLAFTAESVTHRLIETIAPRFADRPGGYTRVVRLPDRRIGDHSRLALVQLVGGETSPGTLTKPGKTARRRRADRRYAMAIRLAKQWGAKGRGGGKPQHDAPDPEAADTGTTPESTEPPSQRDVDPQQEG